MSQRTNSRSCNNNEQWIEEPNRNNNHLSQIIEEQCDDERYTRYDPKELRDAARILSPFLKLIDEVNNPYARLVAQELCDTFHSLFYPNQDPLDVKQSFNSLLRSQKSLQVWNEIRLYSPGSKCKKWVPLCKEPIVEINEEYDPCRPQDNTDFGPSDQQQCPNSKNFNQQLSQSNNRNYREQNPTQNCVINEPPIPTTRQSPEYVSYDDKCDLDSNENVYDVKPPDNMFDGSYQNLSDVSPPGNMFDDSYQNVSGVNPLNNMHDNSYQNLCDISPPNNMPDISYQNLSAISPPDVFDDSYHNACDDNDTMHCDHQLSAGSDSLPVTQRSEQSSRLYSEDILGTSDDAGRNEKQRVDMYLDVMSEETIDKSEIDNRTVQQVSSLRQHAGNDVYFPSCEPGCSKDPDYIHNENIENPTHYEYYRVSGNSSSPPRNANGPNVLQTVQTSPIQPEIRTNALEITENNYECDESDSDESQVNANQIARNAEIVANAFTTVSLAQQEFERKKNAFGALTKNYLNHVPNSVETGPPTARDRSMRKMLKSICKNPPNTLMPFSNSEWNDNCFRDEDFVRLLPFYEIMHNQLEHIAEIQREYGFNMLDDIMPVFYHIHYDLGDPRLKNDMLIEHVKLVTKNTWESFFYPANQKMPAIPAKPDRYFSPSPLRQSLSQHLSPIQANSRRVSPKPSNQVPPALRQISLSPLQRNMTQHSSPTQVNARQASPILSPQQEPSAPRQDCQNQLIQENPPIATQKNFLRRSQPSGAPKNWVPKVKAVERPKEVRKFKAKPLPKFIRDRLNSRDRNC